MKRFTEMSIMITYQQMGKRGNPKPLGRERKKNTRSSVNNGSSHMHRPSIAACMVLSTYHNMPADFNTSWQWVEVNDRHYLTY
jgi:hypothetical protein